MDGLILGAVIIGVPLMLGMVLMALHAARLVYVTATIQHPLEVKYFSFEGIPMPKALRELDTQLDAWGFERLGSIEARFPHLPAGNEWQYRSPDGAIYVEITQSAETEPARAQFASIFADHAMIITRFPGGEKVRTRDYLSRYAANSLEAALEFHQDQLEQWQQERGDALLTNTMADVTRYDKIWTEKHRLTDYRRLMMTFCWLTFSRLLVALTAFWGIAATIDFARGAALTVAPYAAVTGMIALEWLVVSISKGQAHGQTWAVDGGQKAKKGKHGE
jgi:hypothetical protein